MTSLVHQRCSNHPARKAVVHCPECRRFFCRECVTDHSGRMLCASCVSRLAAGAGLQAGRSPGALWVGLALGGLLVAWLVFYYLGMALARIPSEFHGGPA